jgi:hypothetical protein
LKKINSTQKKILTNTIDANDFGVKVESVEKYQEKFHADAEVVVSAGRGLRT